MGATWCGFPFGQGEIAGAPSSNFGFLCRFWKLALLLSEDRSLDLTFHDVLLSANGFTWVIEAPIAGFRASAALP